MITAHLSHNAITSNEQEALSLNEKSSWGEKKQGLIEYSMIEAIALAHDKKMRVLSGKKELPESSLLKKARKSDKRISIKLPAFIDLRKRGYIVKTALKFGAEFRVYDKGVRPGQDHAAWLFFPVKENETLTWYDFAAKSRVATSTKKKLLLGIVDDEGDVTYYQTEWIRP